MRRNKFLSEKDDWKKIEENNVTVVLNILYAKKEKKYPAYVSKPNSKREKHYSFNNSKWREMALSCSKKTVSVIKRNKIKK